MGFFDKLKAGLKKTSEAITNQVNNVFSTFVKVDEELFESLEEALIMADLGVETSTYIIDELRDRVKHKHINDGNEVKNELQNVIADILNEQDTKMHLDTTPSVILVIGVNGVVRQRVSESLQLIIKIRARRFCLQLRILLERRR